MYFLISPQEAARTPSRKGITLLVVITMLGLFAIVGVGFVIYAQSEAASSRTSREGKTMQRPDEEPEAAFHFFMSQLLYGTTYDAAGCQSSLRGHSMADNMFGCNPFFSGSQVVPGNLTSPYSGIGRLKYTYPGALPNNPLSGILSGADSYFLINPQFFSTDLGPNGQPFVLDPDFNPAALRTSPYTKPNGANYIGGWNPSYTYPDLNTMFVAAVNGKGEIGLQSFHRPWTGIGGMDSSDPTFLQRWGTNPLDPAIKYKTLRPHPSWNTFTDPVTGQVKTFPLPEDGGGDVKNWYGGPGVPIPGQPGKYYNNDSLWMDLGHPVLTGPNGVRYKILYAPLIIPLDGKLNVNAHGNMLGTDANNNKISASNQGWGPWEVSLSRILQNPAEYQNLFIGKGVVYGKYGPDQQPTAAGSSATSGQAPRFYAQVDFDGLGPVGNYVLPSEAAGVNQYFAFPKFPAARFDNGTGVLKNHPLLFNPFQPAGDDLPFPVGSLEALWRYGDTGSPALSSDLFKLWPTNFGASAGSPKLPLLFTTCSADLNWAGGSPWLSNPAGYALNGPFPTGNNALAGSPGTMPFSPKAGEFGPWMKSVAAALGPRLDLNQNLPDYFIRTPVYKGPDPNTGTIDLTDPAVVAQYQLADNARKKMAKDIFDRLVLVTTGYRPGDIADPVNSPIMPANKGTPAYNAIRWLAQLSANIVDYRDEDDISTVFQWNPNDSTEVVYGTELPRVVLNEVYTQLSNTGAGLPFDVKLWIELHNPFATDSSLVDSGAARLQTKTAAGGKNYAVYKIEVLQKYAGNPYLTNLNDPANTDGTPNVNDVVRHVDTYNKPGNDPIDTTMIFPADGNYNCTNYTAQNGGNVGYYVLGPQGAFPGQNPITPTKHVFKNDATKKGLQYSLTFAQGLPVVTNTAVLKHTILLRRLANPYIPPSATNPYITVDYVDDVNTNLGSVTDALGNTAPQVFANCFSTGRKQTYTSAKTQWTNQLPPLPVGQLVWTDPQHTFFRQNGQGTNQPNSPDLTLDLPFDWLVHLDRQLISPMELLQVSAFPPHQLTQQFKTATGAFQHLAPWTNEAARIYRFLELVQTKSRIANLAGSRVPGPININMIFDQEVWQALCDEQAATGVTKYNAAMVANIYNQILAKRTPNGLPGPNDQPFKSMATGAIPPGDAWQSPSGIKDTLFTPDITNSTGLMFGVTGQSHPYRKMELLTKIYNNLTVRSNTFAVYVTVGFFEVTDESVSPPRLGQEIGKAENRHVRYRMFSIVDRTQLAAQQPDWGATFTTPVSVGLDKVFGPKLTGFGANPFNGSAPTAGYSFDIVPGTTFLVDPGTAAEEKVIVASTFPAANPPYFTAYFTQPHPIGTKFNILGPDLAGGTPNLAGAMLGHPGPNPAQYANYYTTPMPYYTLIEGK